MKMYGDVYSILSPFSFILILLLILGCVGLFVDSFRFFVIIRQNTIGIVERFGKFSRSLTPGLHFVIPVIDCVVTRVNLQQMQITEDMKTKTQDNVFVDARVVIQFKVSAAKAVDSYYALNNPTAQILSKVADILRSRIAEIKLDDLFNSKDVLAREVLNELESSMSEFGYHFTAVLLPDLNPASEVVEAMNRINAAERNKHAAEQEAEANYIRIVREAESQKERMRLLGEGAANERLAMFEGVKKTVEEFQSLGLNVTSIFPIIQTFQYFDTIKSAAVTGRGQVLLLPSNPDGGSNILNSLIASNALTANTIEQTDKNKGK